MTAMSMWVEDGITPIHTQTSLQLSPLSETSSGTPQVKINSKRSNTYFHTESQKATWQLITNQLLRTKLRRPAVQDPQSTRRSVNGLVGVHAERTTTIHRVASKSVYHLIGTPSSNITLHFSVDKNIIFLINLSTVFSIHNLNYLIYKLRCL